MENLTMNGRLIRKAVSHKTKICEVEKWITISHHEFEKLKAEPFPDIKVEAKPMEEIKFYCPLKIVNYSRICLGAEDASGLEAVEYESAINRAIKKYQSNCEENRGLMAYLHDNKQFCDKVYSIFPSVEVVENSLMGVFTCQVYGELKSYELEVLREELIGQASDGWGEGFEQRAIEQNSDDTRPRKIICHR